MNHLSFFCAVLICALALTSCGGGGGGGSGGGSTPPTTPSNVILVNAGVIGGNNNGSSWANAFIDLQDALALAVSGEEIWAAEGTYYASSTNDPAETFQLIDGVGIYGGFDGTELTRNERDWSTNVTILSGDIGTVAVNTDNTHHVVTGADNAVIDGFTVRDGYATAAILKGGAGILNENVSPTISNCIIDSNSADYGAGIYNYNNADPIISDCTVNNNEATGTFAGGIYNNLNSDPVMTNCTISGNTANTHGGGMFCNSSSSPSLTNCTISGNTANTNGGGMFCDSSSSPSLSNCSITGNTADHGGGIRCNSFSSPSLSNCTISGNTADFYGGGINCLSSSSPSLSNCTISGNTADFYGGGMFCNSSSSPILSNCTISGNTSDFYGGGIFISSSSSPSLSNCTISGNNADANGGAVYLNNSDPIFKNCIVWGNTLGDVTASSLIDEWELAGTSAPVVSYSLFIEAVTGTNNIFGDPLFTDAENGDYTLQDNSPAIDVGDNSVTETVDLVGNPRKVNGPDLIDNIFSAVVDMGAYENQSVGASALSAPVSNN